MEKRRQAGMAQGEIQDVAVVTPVGAKDKQDTFMVLAGTGEGAGEGGTGRGVCWEDIPGQGVRLTQAGEVGAAAANDAPTGGFTTPKLGNEQIEGLRPSRRLDAQGGLEILLLEPGEDAALAQQRHMKADEAHLPPIGPKTDLPGGMADQAGGDQKQGRGLARIECRDGGSVATTHGMDPAPQGRKQRLRARRRSQRRGGKQGGGEKCTQ